MKAIQMFKTIRGDVPEYFRSSFTFASDILLRLRSKFQLLQYSKTSFRNLSKYIFSGSSVWNSLPSYIHNSNSFQHFKAQYLRWVTS